MKRIPIILSVLLALSLIANVILLSRTTGSGGQSQGSRVSQNASPFAGMAVPGVKGRTVPKYLKILPNDNALPSVSSKVLNASVKIGQIQPKAGGWYVRNVILTTGQDISPILNSLGQKFGVSPLFMAATVGTESGFNPNAQRWAGGLDDSCGLLQEILVNVTQVTGLTGYAACAWELVPYNSLWYGNLLMSQYIQMHGGRIQPPQAYILYNAGAGWPDSYYFNPTGQAYSNYYYNFIPNWNYAWAHFVAPNAPISSPPPPPPVPRKPARFTVSQMNHWCGYLRKHRKACPSPYYHGQLSVVAASWLWGRTISRNCAGLAGNERWDSRHRVMTTPFKFCSAWSWPWRDRKVKWAKR